MRLRRITCGRCGRKHLRPFLSGDQPRVPWHRVPLARALVVCPHSGEPVVADAPKRKARRRR